MCGRHGRALDIKGEGEGAVESRASKKEGGEAPAVAEEGREAEEASALEPGGVATDDGVEGAEGEVAGVA